MRIPTTYDEKISEDMNIEKLHQKLIRLTIDAGTDCIVQLMFELAQESPYLAIILAAIIVIQLYIS